MIKYSVNESNFKVFSLDDKYVFVASQLSPVKVPLPGVGYYGRPGGAWLVTLTNTRTSYTFTEGESLAPSYVAERLHIYDVGQTALTTMCNTLQLFLKEVSGENK